MLGLNGQQNGELNEFCLYIYNFWFSFAGVLYAVNGPSIYHKPTLVAGFAIDSDTNSLLHTFGAGSGESQKVSVIDYLVFLLYKIRTGQRVYVISGFDGSVVIATSRSVSMFRSYNTDISMVYFYCHIHKVSTWYLRPPCPATKGDFVENSDYHFCKIKHLSTSWPQLAYTPLVLSRSPS